MIITLFQRASKCMHPPVLEPLYECSLFQHAQHCLPESTLRRRFCWASSAAGISGISGTSDRQPPRLAAARNVIGGHND